MPLALTLHPNSHCKALTRIGVDAERPRSGVLVLRYRLSGTLDLLRLAAAAASTRADELWRHSCFEAFLRPSSGSAYYEFNIAPSTQWAAYGFDSYRSGMRVAQEIAAPRIHVQSNAASLELRAEIEVPNDADWMLGLSAVIEETDGNISYWALAHPPGKPDFHHGDCFAHALARPSRS